jgi:hypothetical protein
LAPASAYSEALVAFARAGRLADAREAIAGMGIAVTPLTAAIAERAAAARVARGGLRLPDAIVLACAHEPTANSSATTNASHESRARGQPSASSGHPQASAQLAGAIA